MTTMAPLRTHDQRTAALEHANHIRTYRSHVKRNLKTLRHVAAYKLLIDLIESPPPELATMKVWDLVINAPYIGKVKATQIMVTARISDRKTVGGLSERQRAELVAIIDRRWF